MKTLKELKADAAVIVKAIDDGTATEDQIKSMGPLREQITEAKQREQEEKAFRAVLSDAIAGGAEVPAGGQGLKTLGDHFVSEMRHERKSAFGMFTSGDLERISTSEFKAAGDASSFDPNHGGLPTVQRDVEGIARTQLTVAGLMSQGTLDGDSLVYFEEIAGEGGVGTVSPGASKPYVRYKYQQVREGLSKIAGLTKILDEMIEDYAFLRSEINTTLVQDLMTKEEEQLLAGNGTAPNLRGLLNRSGVLTATATDADLSDKVFSSTMQILTSAQRTADGIVINPADYEKQRLAKDDNGQYLGGGPFQGPYGNGGISLYPPLWGLNTVVTPAIAAGTVLVGAFKTATVYRKGGVRVDATNSNVDDFETNQITMRAEERIALKVPRPSAFAKITVGGTGG